MEQSRCARRFPVGAELLPQGGVQFRVWAPKRRRVEAVLESGSQPAVPLRLEDQGYFSGVVESARAGSLYRFRLDEDPKLYPDPASRFQPEGPHGPSQVIDPSSFRWTDRSWQGCRREGQVIYEMHVGTFTPEGTWDSARRELPVLADLGVTLLEVMPVADFPGRFGWGYDGVALFAPTRLYGGPDDFRRFIDAAHDAGLGVVLDVVYNHLGPDGNYLREFSNDYFTNRYDNEWGDALNFDGPNSGPVRAFFQANAAYWIAEYHLDGLRLDATQQIFDRSPEYMVSAIARSAREAAAGRTIVLIGENEPQDVRLLRPRSAGGCGLNALWNDDYHHSAQVALTGRNEAYYSDYLGNPQEFVSMLKHGFLYQGQRYSWQKKRRGTPTLDQPPAAFVVFLQNHDQVANSGRGWRCHQLTSPGRFRALTALTLLGPNTPLLFQGQEFCSSSPFLFFADHKPDLARLVAAGRRQFLSQFPTIAQPNMQQNLASPEAPETFQRCKLNPEERKRHAEAWALHRDLLHLRRTDPVFRAPRLGGVDGAVLGPEALVLRFFGGEHGDRLLLLNLGRDLHLNPAPEPLLAPPEQAHWELLWSSEDPRYGGYGTPPLETEANWLIHGQAAVVLVAVPTSQQA